MATTAPMRANEYVITAIGARSRRPTYGAPLLPGRDMKGGVEVACAEALSAELHPSFSNVGIERVFPRTKPARCCPECCPNLARDDQRVRSFHLTL